MKDFQIAHTNDYYNVVQELKSRRKECHNINKNICGRKNKKRRTTTIFTEETKKHKNDGHSEEQSGSARQLAEKLECPVCRKKYSTQSGLDKHISQKTSKLFIK